MFLVFGYKDPKIQMGPIFTLYLVYVLYIYATRPFKVKRYNYFLCIIETIMLIINMIFFIQVS